MTIYIERDIRQIMHVQNLNLFQRFVALCAARTGQLLNLATECGLSQSTAHEWLSVLEASYIVHLLRPHHENLGKRVVKTLKLYFHDTGLAAFLMGIRDERQLSLHPALGAPFETLVVGEFLKSRFNTGERSNIFFWRDNIGAEVDLLVEDVRGLFPVESKAGKTWEDEYIRSLRLFASYSGPRANEACLVHGGDGSYTRQDISVRSWRDL